MKPRAVKKKNVDKSLNEVFSCSKCFSANLRTPRYMEWVPGSAELSGFVLCEKCGFRGLPISFPSIAAYKKFIKNKKPASRKK